MTGDCSSEGIRGGKEGAMIGALDERETGGRRHTRISCSYWIIPVAAIVAAASFLYGYHIGRDKENERCVQVLRSAARIDSGPEMSVQELGSGIDNIARNFFTGVLNENFKTDDRRKLLWRDPEYLATNCYGEGARFGVFYAQGLISGQSENFIAEVQNAEN